MIDTLGVCREGTSGTTRRDRRTPLGRQLERRIAGIIFSLCFCSLVLLGGCGLLPTTGPTTMDVMLGQRDLRSLPYALVRLTPRVIALLGKAAPRLAAFEDRRRPRDIRLGVGDIVSVTIFEASPGGLFIPAEGSTRPGNFVTIPNQPVDNNGNISIPYAGQILARGVVPKRRCSKPLWMPSKIVQSSHKRSFRWWTSGRP